MLQKTKFSRPTKNGCRSRRVQRSCRRRSMRRHYECSLLTTIKASRLPVMPPPLHWLTCELPNLTLTAKRSVMESMDKIKLSKNFTFSQENMKDTLTAFKDNKSISDMAPTSSARLSSHTLAPSLALVLVSGGSRSTAS